MTNTKVLVVQKARYGVLFLPVVWLLFSIWAIVNSAFPRFTYLEAQEVTSPPSVLEILNVALYACCTLWVAIKILQALKNHFVISAELKSGFVFSLGLTLMRASANFHPSQFLSCFGIAMVDIAAIIMIVTLLQGKPFAQLKLYHKDIQVKKNS